jgi:hypothetical protein
MAFWNTKPVFDTEKGSFVAGDKKPRDTKKYDKQYAKYGEMSRQDVYESCWKYVHDMSIDDALAADDPLIQTLAVIDKRVGKNRLSKIDKSILHPLARKLMETRLKSEIESGANKKLERSPSATLNLGVRAKKRY